MIIALQTLVFFRESLINAVTCAIGTYYRRIKGTLIQNEADEEDDEEVYAEFDDTKGVIFFPPMYLQRYAAVSDCLMDERWCGKLEKIVDLGYHDMSFIKYLKDLPGVHCILGVDIESIPLRCSSELLGCEGYNSKRETPLQVTLFQGNAADPDYRLIGCDAVVAIEMIEHMLPHDLDRLVHTVFGFVKPWIAIFTTPNADFNELFKSLEKNGLRRLDHFFEWTREQFHDWCSNIVLRYPDFTVHCQGVGPGPPETEHYGCCSQLALFINKNYVKQKDLNINSLALVSKVPSPVNLPDDTSGFESPMPDTGNMICRKEFENSDSYSDILYANNESCVTILITSPMPSPLSINGIACRQDKTAQCNMDVEIGKSYLMFDDDEMCLTVVMPRREYSSRVYYIEDVASRLNCTTFQVTKFSKTTQNLMAKNSIDALAHTREVVNEIKHLRNMLNFNKEALMPKQEKQAWYNYNWGENAPYWNQYYKIVREYNYPFEVKSDEARILDLISEEINRLVDFHLNEESGDDNKVEIPLMHLMAVVSHITTDVENVKDILEWNGYEIVGDKLIHSRFVVDAASLASTDVDWPDDTASELDTVISSSVSDGSNLVNDYQGRVLRRAIDKKVRVLREMLTLDEDITTELDRVVCRLMKLALRTSKHQKAPPPSRWMECKLLDLLTLAEKSVSRRKRHYLEMLPMKVIQFDKQVKQMITLTEQCRDNNKVSQLIQNYNHLMNEVDFHENMICQSYQYTEKENTIITDPTICNEDVKFLRYEQYEVQKNTAFMLDTSQVAFNKHTRSKRTKPSDDFEKPTRKRSYRNVYGDYKQDDTSRVKKSKTYIGRAINKNKVNSVNRNDKKVRNEYGMYKMKSKRITHEYKKLQPTASKPIPSSLIELCHPELNMPNNKEFNYSLNEISTGGKNVEKSRGNTVSFTEESLLIDIVMDNTEQNLVLHRTIGTGADESGIASHNTILGEMASKIMQDHTQQASDEKYDSNIIFLNDINEPTTSKGIRHCSMDVQCGTDTTPFSGLITPMPSIHKMAKVCSAGIKIDSLTNVTSKDNTVNARSPDRNSSFNENISAKIFSIDKKNNGIKIENSTHNSSDEIHRTFDTTLTITMIDNKEDTNFHPNADNFAAASAPSRTVSNFSNYRKENYRVNVETSSDLTSVVKRVFCRAQSPTSFGITFRESASELNDIETDPHEDNCAVSPRSKSPTCYADVQMDDSLSNLLVNIEYQPGYRSRSVSPQSTSRISPRKFYINSKTLDFESKPQKSDSINRTVSPTLFTKVKMIDLINDVSIEQEIESSHLPPSKYCKILSPTKSRSRSPEIRCEMKNSIHLSKCINAIDTCTSTLELIKRNTIEVGVPMENDFNVSKFHEKCELETCKEEKLSDILDDKFKDNHYGFSQCKDFGFKVKDSNDNIIKKVEFSSNHVELLSDNQTSLQPVQLVSSTRTELLKSAPRSLKTDSASEICASPCFMTNANTTPNTSDYKIKERLNQIRKLRPNKSPVTLTCGGVHVHSFKDKQSLGDIIYQGEWKHQITKTGRKPSQAKTIVAKKVPEMKSSKNRIATTKGNISDRKNEKISFGKAPQIESNKANQVRRIKPSKVKQDSTDKVEQSKKVALPNIAKAAKTNKPLTKVASKIMTNSLTSKNTWSLRSSKRPSSVTHPIPNKPTGKTDYFRKLDLDSKYLPAYLKRRKMSEMKKIDFDTSNSKSRTLIENTTLDDNKQVASLVCADVTKQHILQDFMVTRPMNYAVFRNELENSGGAASNSQSIDINITEVSKRKRSIHKQRSSSPISQNSSTCSTADSSATVRVNTNWNKSTVKNKSSSGNLEIDTSASNKNKKNVKRNKNHKKADGKDSNNKENIPEPIKIPGTGNMEGIQNLKNVIICRSKNLFDNMLAPSKHQTPNKSNVKIPTLESNEEKKVGEKVSKNVTHKKSGQSVEFSTEDINIQSSLHSDASNVVLLVERKTTQDQESAKKDDDSHLFINEQQPADAKVIDSDLLAEWLETSSEGKDTENAILSAMRQLVEERLNFIGSTLLLGEGHDDDTMSVKSYRTVIALENTDAEDTFRSEIENIMNHSLYVVSDGDDLESSRNDTDAADIVSFKSATSASRYSDYFMAESTVHQEKVAKKPKSSVLDIFERKDLDNTLVPNCAGNLASVAFSGFSMNAESTMGDQIDYVPPVDSEADSLAMDVARQTTSEELFVSGRSSETYESCAVEEEVSVPDWLFRVMNPHLVIPVRGRADPVNLIDSETGSITEGYGPPPIAEGDEEQQELLPLPMPMVQPVFDVNGNAIEPGIGLGAGAGDGRGMHSDHSENSSGNGSSLSSSDASSGQQSEMRLSGNGGRSVNRSQDTSGNGPSLTSTETSYGQQSEAILIDPSAFTTQYELFHEPVGSSMAVTTLVVPTEASDNRQARPEHEALSTSHNSACAPRMQMSDGEADISSLSTDAHDSS